MILLGNILSFSGCLLMVILGFVKTKSKVLWYQIFQFVLMGSGHVCLGAPAGVVANIVSILRNITFLKFKSTTWIKIGFIVLQAGLTMISGMSNPVEWLPVIAIVIFTWFVDSTSQVGFKVLNIVCQVLWCVYDLSYMNFAGFTFDLLSIVTNFVGICLIRKSLDKNDTVS